MLLWMLSKSWYLWYLNNEIAIEGGLRCCECSQVDILYLNNFSKETGLHNSCELLSKVDIFDIRTTTHTARRSLQLWIAQSWYLWYSEQPLFESPRGKWCCECSQKLISLIFWTTTLIMKGGDRLWIAQKLISLIFGTTRFCPVR